MPKIVEGDNSSSTYRRKCNRMFFLEHSGSLYLSLTPKFKT